MYAATGGPNVKWGGTDFKWGGRAPLAPRWRRPWSWPTQTPFRVATAPDGVADFGIALAKHCNLAFCSFVLQLD